ncbi:MAG: M20/M25/M40 family metallo-hydrolase [Clostridia bacterium]|nr:M20/M25/M40 family metallo-hydrolase [Clostridia bacterium]
MKASESVKNYPSTLRMYANYTTREIKKVCKTIGPRASGSDKEREAQEHFKGELETCSDHVVLEDFRVHPVAFMAWVVIDGISLLLAVLFSFLNMPVISLALTVFAVLCLFTEFLMYWEFLDPFFPAKTSCNCIGTRKPTGEVKQRIVFSGHVDSAWEWRFMHIGGHALFFGGTGYAVAGLLYLLVISILQIVQCGPFLGADPDGALWVLRWVELGFVPGFVLIMFFTNFHNPVTGANDNLTGTVTSIAVLKYLQDNNIRFEHTEVVAATVGCEECGLRGSRAYVKQHKDELTAVPTVFFCMDTLRDFDDMAIYSRDMTGTVKNDPRVCALMKKAGAECGMDLPYHSVYLGASDAAAVTKLGVPAATLAAMEPTGPRYYHTRRDTEELLVPKTIEKSIDICLNALFILDEQGLKENYDA